LFLRDANLLMHDRRGWIVRVLGQVDVEHGEFGGDAIRRS